MATSPLEECRRQCFKDFSEAVKAAFETWKENMSACAEAFAVAKTRCADTPDPAACLQQAEENFSDCRKQASDLLVANVDTARIQLDNCLTMCSLQHPR